MAIKTYIVKVASRCNLNCSYCYMYNMGDTTYLQQPKFMDMGIVRAFAERLKEYYKDREQNSIYIAFHGGEPLMASPEFYQEAVKIIRDTLNGVEVYFTMQTNGTLLTEEWAKLLNELDIQVGISIDGPEAFHDKFRVYHNGKPSFTEVVEAFKIRNKHGVGGLITVVNPEIDVVELYNLFAELLPKKLNLLLPDSNYMNTDFYLNKTEGETRYGDWLVDLYELWKNDDPETRPEITFFSNIIRNLLGNEVADERFGSMKCEVACLETNGALEVVDPLRSCGHGFTRNRLNIKKNNIEDLEKEALYQVYSDGHQLLNNKCQNCPVKELCGGGYLVHRYSKERGFDNPSIYCYDMIRIITHIQNDFVKSLGNHLREGLGVSPITYEEVTDYLKNSPDTSPEPETEASKILQQFATRKKEVIC
ncbi:MAG: radical SAM protein [Bacteroidota bacterium]